LAETGAQAVLQTKAAFRVPAACMPWRAPKRTVCVPWPTRRTFQPRFLSTRLVDWHALQWHEAAKRSGPPVIGLCAQNSKGERGIRQQRDCHDPHKHASGFLE
jgi:hypothetical protein